MQMKSQVEGCVTALMTQRGTSERKEYEDECWFDGLELCEGERGCFFPPEGLCNVQAALQRYSPHRSGFHEISFTYHSGNDN